MGLDLVELEVAAYSVQEEDFVIENTIHKMTDNIDQMSLNGSKEEKWVENHCFVIFLL